MDQEKIQSKALEINQWLQVAVGDCAYDIIEISDIESYYGKEVATKAKSMKRNGHDWRGWLADELYNSKDILMDLAGDKIHDGVIQIGVDSSNKELFNEFFIKIATALKESGHRPLRDACDALIKMQGGE